MFVLTLKSRRQLHRQSATPSFLANLNGLAGVSVETVPHDDTVAYYLERLDCESVAVLPAYVVRRLIRMKALDRWRLHGRFMITLDATGQRVYHHRHCPRCLTQRRSDGRVVYFHHVLEAKLVTASGLAFSVATEFIENADPQAGKQDCERKAFVRLAQRLKANFPQLPILLLADSLYACKAVFDICRRNGRRYIFTFKEGSLPALFAEYQTLRDLATGNRASHRRHGVRQQFAWVNDLEYETHRLSAFECREPGPDASRYFAWITDIPVGCASVITLANQGGRLRWKIENEGFNVQKNNGYELEHAYSENETANKNFYYLLQVAHAINQLVCKGSLVGDFDGLLGSLRNYALQLLVSFCSTVIGPDALDLRAAAAIQIRLDTS